MPTTPEGKAIASQNSLRHGCCSEKILIPGESEKELHALRDGWLADYDPPSEPALGLVLEAVKQYWLLLRNERFYHKTVYSLPDDLAQWSEAQHKAVERAERYHTAAQRRFHRAFQDLEQYYKAHKPPKSGNGCEFPASATSEPRTAVRGGNSLSPSSPSQAPVPENPPPPPPFKNPFTGRDAPKNQRKIVILDQWAEIYIDEHGKTVTRLYPSNEDLIKEGHRMDPPPELVYRRLNFLGLVPPEYGWASRLPERLANGGMATQRMTVETWLETIAREKESGTGHIGRCGKPLPRPKEHGECDCPTCTRLYAKLAES